LASASVFICYAHVDNAPRKRWLDRLRVHLAPFVRHTEIAVWSDQNLETGQKWDEEIARQLQTARVAVLLVSPDFLASEYIANSELPVLLKRAHDDGMTILPLLLYPSAYQYARFKWPDPKDGPNDLTLSSIQAAGSPSETLSEMKRPKQDRVLVELAKCIHGVLNSEGVSRSTPPRDEESHISISHLPSAGAYLVGREAELTRLQQAWESPREHVISVIGRGGEGKSNLVRHWLNDLAANGWPDAGRVYGWSFYSQGTNDKAASADQFIDQALRFFGEPEPERLKSADARGERLAQLVGSGRNLLVLDGLEPLQYPPGPMQGRLKDPALQTLLAGLTAKNRGLCVITTRERLPDLASTAHSMTPEIELPPLTPDAGARLLANLGVTGSDGERETVATKLGGHAFSIHLLGTYLAEVYDGDIARAGEVALLDEDSESGKHARHLLASYEKWLSGRTLTGSDLSPEEAAEAKQTGAEILAVLRLLGLFDRPATMAAIDALRVTPAIAGLTEPLVSLSFAEWHRTLARLRNLQLIDHDLGEVETIDAHPLLREYFAEQLKNIPESATEAHGRLYDHFKTTAPDLPETLRDMAPLFQAVVHGCKAGKWQDALDEVVYRRIQRGDDDFASRHLGATGACLASIAAFFIQPWRRVTAAFSGSDTGYILNSVGFYLGAVGRFSECAEPLMLAIETAIAEKQWPNACVAADNLSDIHQTLGDIAAAVRYAEQATELAIRSDDTAEMRHRAATLADVLHAAGAQEDARQAFADAEAMPSLGELGLVALSGFRYTDLLLCIATRVSREAEDRLQSIREIAMRNEQHLEYIDARPYSLYTRALPRLLIGRTCALLAEDLSRARQLFDDAISLLREASQAHLLATGLVWRAEFARRTKHREAADRYLTEAEQLADRHGMLRWQIESAVERAWFHHTFGDSQAAREKLAEAKQVIARTEKPYVPHVWTFEGKAPPPYIGVFKEGDIIGYHRCDDSIAELERQLA
jgi:tetratricopeptide (TPR) repeat protein